MLICLSALCPPQNTPAQYKEYKTAHRQGMRHGHDHEQKTTIQTNNSLKTLWSMAMTTGERPPAFMLEAKTPRSLRSGLRWSTWPHICVRKHHSAQWEVLCFSAQWLNNNHKPRASWNYKNYLEASSFILTRDGGLLEELLLWEGLGKVLVTLASPFVSEFTLTMAYKSSTIYQLHMHICTYVLILNNVTNI